MRIRAGPTERVNAGQGRFLGALGPVHHFVRYSHRQLIPLQCRVWILKVKVLRNFAVTHRQYGFDHAGDPCCGSQMSNIGFD